MRSKAAGWVSTRDSTSVSKRKTYLFGGLANSALQRTLGRNMGTTERSRDREKRHGCGLQAQEARVHGLTPTD